jgi:hypothetical protein
MQERRSRRAVAALSAALLIVMGLLGARHEAEVAHVRDGNGDLVHGQELAEHHENGAAAHMHGREDHSHIEGACGLLAVLHAPAVASRPPAALVPLAVSHELTVPAIAAVHGAIPAYRLAPKTSPPALS